MQHKEGKCRNHSYAPTKYPLSASLDARMNKARLHATLFPKLARATRANVLWEIVLCNVLNQRSCLGLNFSETSETFVADTAAAAADTTTAPESLAAGVGLSTSEDESVVLLLLSLLQSLST